MNNQDAALEFSAKKLPLTSYRVLAYMQGVAEYGNRVMATQTDIARHLDVSRQQVWHGIKALVAAGVLHEDGRIGSTKIYWIEPDFLWKGKTRNLEEVRRARAERAIRHE